MADQTIKTQAFTAELPVATLKQLRAYAKKHGLKIKTCLRQAVDAWLAAASK